MIATLIPLLLHSPAPIVFSAVFPPSRDTRSRLAAVAKTAIPPAVLLQQLQSRQKRQYLSPSHRHHTRNCGKNGNTSSSPPLPSASSASFVGGRGDSAARYISVARVPRAPHPPHPPHRVERRLGSRCAPHPHVEPIGVTHPRRADAQRASRVTLAPQRRGGA